MRSTIGSGSAFAWLIENGMPPCSIWAKAGRETKSSRKGSGRSMNTKFGKITATAPPFFDREGNPVRFGFGRIPVRARLRLQGPVIHRSAIILDHWMLDIGY